MSFRVYNKVSVCVVIGSILGILIFPEKWVTVVCVVILIADFIIWKKKFDQSFK